MGGMFYECICLENLDLSKFDTKKVTYMRNMFYNCTSLTNLDVSGFNTTKVTNFDSMFYGCSNLNEIDVSGFNTSSATAINHMFYNCSKVKILDVSSFKTSKVKYMSNMFYGCSSLTNLDLSSFNTTNITNFSNMFNGCTALEKLDISGFTIGSSATVTNMLNFGTGNKIMKIVVPKSVGVALPITTGSVLYDTSTGDVKTSIATTDGGKIFAVKINLAVDADGGECDVSTVVVYYDTAIGESGMASLPTPTKTGSQFSGWRKNYFDTVDFRDSFNTLYRTGYTKFTIADNKTLAANAGIGRYDKGTYILNDGTAFGSAVRAYWKPSENLVYGKYRISYDAYCPVLTSSTTNWSTAIDILYKTTTGSYYVFNVKNKGEEPVLATTTDANGRNLRIDSTTLKHYSNEFTIDENFLGLFLALNSAYQTYFENIKLELIETADGSDYPAEAKVSSESSFNVEQSISAIWEAVPVEVTIKVRVENNVTVVGLGSGTVSYIDATGSATSLSISSATTTVKVLQGSDLSVKVTAKTDYVFVGATKEGTTPHPTEKPSDTTEFLGISEDTTINIYINLLSQNVLKYDENEKYFYFECGSAPQSYVGDELNERLRTSNDRSILGDSFGKINGFEAIDDSGELFVYSIYDSVEDSWGDYVGIKANKTQGLLLNDEWVEVVAGEEYWFNVETIRWRVSDYGVSSTDYPEGWSDYGSINYRFNAVSDKIIWANSLTSGQYDAGAGWSAKDAFGDCADNIFGNIQIVDMYGTSNVVKANIQGNAFADAGSDNVSGGASVNLVFANESTLREKFNDLRAKVTDFTAFVMGIDSNQFARYWIGDLGSKYYNVKSVGANGNIKDAWTTNILGCRLVAYFYGGSRV